MEKTNRIKAVCGVETKSLPATNTKGHRMKGSFEGFTATISWDHGQDTVDNYYMAAQKVIDKFNADREAKWGIKNDLKLDRFAVVTKTGYVFPIR